MELIAILEWAQSNAPHLIIPLSVIALLFKAVFVLSRSLPTIIKIVTEIKLLHEKTLRELTELRSQHDFLEQSVVSLTNEHRTLKMRVVGIEESCNTCAVNRRSN